MTARELVAMIQSLPDDQKDLPVILYVEAQGQGDYMEASGLLFEPKETYFTYVPRFKQRTQSALVIS